MEVGMIMRRYDYLDEVEVMIPEKRIEEGKQIKEEKDDCGGRCDQRMPVKEA